MFQPLIFRGHVSFQGSVQDEKFQQKLHNIIKTPPKKNMLNPKNGALQDDFPFERGEHLMYQPIVCSGEFF